MVRFIDAVELAFLRLLRGDAGVGRRKLVQQRARALLQQGGPHGLHLLGDLRPFLEMGEFGLKLGQGGAGLLKLLVIAVELGAILAGAIRVKFVLQLVVVRLVGIAGVGKMRRHSLQLRLIPDDLRGEARRLLLELRDVGAGKCRIQSRENVPLGDAVAFVDIDALHDRRVERLMDGWTRCRDDLARHAGDNPIEFGKNRNQAQGDEHRGDGVQGHPRRNRIGRLAETGNLRLELTNDFQRAWTSGSIGSRPRHEGHGRCASQMAVLLMPQSAIDFATIDEHLM